MNADRSARRAVGVAADMIPVHSDPPVFRRRAAMSQFPAAKDHPARATTPTPRRSGEATLDSFAAYIDSYLCTVTSTLPARDIDSVSCTECRKVHRAPSSRVKTTPPPSPRRGARFGDPRGHRGGGLDPAGYAAFQGPVRQPGSIAVPAETTPRHRLRGAARGAAARRPSAGSVVNPSGTAQLSVSSDPRPGTP